MPKEGAITVETCFLQAGRKMSIRVTDTGKGIEEAIIEKVFQPFFTTKPNGTGLGLAITKGLIEQHGGAIAVMNNGNRGVSFVITLPVRRVEEVISYETTGENLSC